MFKLDDKFLTELGLGSLPAQEKNKMLAHIYETLEMRVGMKLAEKMSNEQLDEFESFINNNNEAGALKWLETNFPNYKQVVADELEKLKGEIKQSAPQIIAQVEASPAPSPQPPAGQSQAGAPQQPQQPITQQPAPQQPVQPSPQPQVAQPTQPQQTTPPSMQSTSTTPINNTPTPQSSPTINPAITATDPQQNQQFPSAPQGQSTVPMYQPQQNAQAAQQPHQSYQPGPAHTDSNEHQPILNPMPQNDVAKDQQAQQQSPEQPEATTPQPPAQPYMPPKN